MPQNILFVCLGNICRSCTAEEIFRTMVTKKGLTEKFAIDSAGLINYHEGEFPDKRMRQAAARHGYILTHRSRPIVPKDFEQFDLIVAMDNRNKEKLMRLASTSMLQNKIIMMADYLHNRPIPLTSIPDPYYGSEDDFENVVCLLEEACARLLETLWHNYTPAQ